MAHTPNSDGEWHTLADHLLDTAERARRFGEPLGFGDAAWWTGLWHDVGKGSCIFQDYLREAHRSGSGVARSKYPNRDHKRAGARLALEAGLPAAALAVMGHHNQIPSASQIKNDPTITADDQIVASVEAALADRHPAGLRPTKVPFPVCDRSSEGLRDFEMFARFLASCLVDADRLDTEAHRDGEREEPDELAAVADRFRTRLAERFDAADIDATPVNQARQRWADHVRARATESPPGLYRMSGRTGIGKTLGGMGAVFAHAEAHNMRRVIIATPYMSVTDQTADALRPMCDGATPALLEHHSMAEDASGWARLAVENWDAPVVVTTTVQLFESLLSNRPSRFRKLHRLANSVIILDEVQTLPRGSLRPILSVLSWLVRHAGATVVLQTATQPVFENATRSGIEDLPDWGDIDLGTVMDRVEWTVDLEPVDHERLARELTEHHQVLCIVNTVSDAQRIWSTSPPDTFCLTTRLTRADRLQMLGEIRDRLSTGQQCVVVATQLVEAGVDLDFPTVWRTFGPMTSLAQAAGRCNRNGLLPQPGAVKVFELKGAGTPPGEYGHATHITRNLARRFETFNPEAPDQIRDFYDRLYPEGGRSDEIFDTAEVNKARVRLDFPEVNDRFRMIADTSVEVVVPHRAVAQILERLRAGNPLSRADYRALARHSATITEKDRDHWFDEGSIELTRPEDDLSEGDQTLVWRGPYGRAGIPTLEPEPQRRAA